jgi:hypothetical protein
MKKQEARIKKQEKDDRRLRTADREKNDEF